MSDGAKRSADAADIAQQQQQQQADGRVKRKKVDHSATAGGHAASSATSGSHQLDIAAHYNRIQQVDVKQRKQSTIIGSVSQPTSCTAQHSTAQHDWPLLLTVIRCIHLLVRRATCPVVRLKSYNNWVKSVLISSHCRARASVLDICGGKVRW